MPFPFAVTALIFSNQGNILSVSRKDNFEDFNLPGGKIDPEEAPLEAILRELKEETGLDLCALETYYKDNLIEEFIAEDSDGNICLTFMLFYSLPEDCVEVGEREGEGVVAWKTWGDITGTNTYASYNKELKETHSGERLKIFSLGFGYVESASITQLVFEHRTGFTSRLFGLRSIRQFLREMMGFDKQSNWKPTRDCCKESIKEKDNNFCPKCGGRLSPKIMLDYEAGDLFIRAFSYDNDTAAGEIGHYESDRWGWEIDAIALFQADTVVGADTFDTFISNHMVEYSDDDENTPAEIYEADDYYNKTNVRIIRRK